MEENLERNQNLINGIHLKKDIIEIIFGHINNIKFIIQEVNTCDFN